MHINIDFLAGFLSYGLLELLVVIVVVRYFPSKVTSLYGIGAAIQRIFAKNPVLNDITEEEELYDEDRCDCPMCEHERSKIVGKSFPVGTEIIVNDENESYGVRESTIRDIVQHPNGTQYWVGSGGVLVPIESESITSGYEDFIPEGTTVRFAMPDDRGSWGHYKTGVTFKAKVRGGLLYYTIEYPDGDNDVAQVDVIADDVWVKETDTPTPEEFAQAAEAQALAGTGVGEPMPAVPAPAPQPNPNDPALAELYNSGMMDKP